MTWFFWKILLFAHQISCSHFPAIKLNSIRVLEGRVFHWKLSTEGEPHSSEHGRLPHLACSAALALKNLVLKKIFFQKNLRLSPSALFLESVPGEPGLWWPLGCCLLILHAWYRLPSAPSQRLWGEKHQEFETAGERGAWGRPEAPARREAAGAGRRCGRHDGGAGEEGAGPAPQRGGDWPAVRQVVARVTPGGWRREDGGGGGRRRLGRGVREVPHRPDALVRGVAQGPGDRALSLQVQRPGAASGGQAAAERRRGGRRGATVGRAAGRAGVRAGRQPHRHRGAVGRRGAPAALHAAPGTPPPLPRLRLPLHTGPGGLGL